MYYVYLLRSIQYSEHTYVGFTDKLEVRLYRHNMGKSSYTSRYAPWRLVCYFALANKTKALAFERYLKSGSGMAFATKHFW